MAKKKNGAGEKKAAAGAKPRAVRKSMFVVAATLKSDETPGVFEQSGRDVQPGFGLTVVAIGRRVRTDEGEEGYVPFASSEACDRWIDEHGEDGENYTIVQLKAPKQAREGELFARCTVKNEPVRSFS